VRDFYRRGNADANKVRVLRDAAKSVRDFPARLWSGNMLEECRGIGAQFRAVRALCASRAAWRDRALWGQCVCLGSASCTFAAAGQCVCRGG